MIFKVLSEGGLSLAKNALRYSIRKSRIQLSPGGEVAVLEPRLNLQELPEADLTQGIPVFGSGLWEMAAAELAAVASLRPDLRNPFLHIQLSLHPEDRTLSDLELTELALEGLRELGYGDCPVCISRHRDEPHAHLHIVTSRVTYAGARVVRDHEMRRAMEWCRAVEIREGLHRVQGKGQPVLPPLGREHEARTVQAPGAVEVGRLALQQTLRPGLTVRELVDGLVALGHPVRPVLTKDGTRLKTLAVQVEGMGEFLPLSTFGDYSLQKMTQKHGLAPVAASDLQALARVLHAEVPPPISTKISQEPPRLTPAPVPLLPLPARLTPEPAKLMPKPPQLTPLPTLKEIPYVHRAEGPPPKPLSWLDRARQWWGEFWTTGPGRKPDPGQALPNPGRLRIG